MTTATNEWLSDRAREDSAVQVRFRSIALTAANATCQEAEDRGALRDYLGHALPTCRVSDAIVSLRPGYL